MQDWIQRVDSFANLFKVQFIDSELKRSFEDYTYAVYWKPYELLCADRIGSTMTREQETGINNNWTGIDTNS